MCQYFGTMNKIVLCVAVAVAVVSVSEAQPDCPPAACPKIRYPDQCRADSWRIINGQLCKHCDKCILEQPDAPIDNGCPVMPCLPKLIPSECLARSYFLWKGRLCPDCDVDICPPEPPMSA